MQSLCSRDATAPAFGHACPRTSRVSVAARAGGAKRSSQAGLLRSLTALQHMPRRAHHHCYALRVCTQAYTKDATGLQSLRFSKPSDQEMLQLMDDWIV